MRFETAGVQCAVFLAAANLPGLTECFRAL